ncbi:MAG: dihydroorotate dehydrogenase-like protein [Planctomycetes bacterium]|nr:dihydroorotate dehydrogenase-like protein [Planctomycetota bacterium]
MRTIPDLTTNYLGLRLKNPLIAGASPLCRDLDQARRLEDAGIAALVPSSLFQEEIEHELSAHNHFEQLGAHSYAEALSYAPGLNYTPGRPQEYANLIATLKAAVEVPVIGSLNGSTLGGWIDYAKLIEQAGADALELNIYVVATDPQQSGADLERRYIDILSAVKATVSIPVALKLAPYFSSLAHFAREVDRRGVDGLILFNRFYQPDIDLEQLQVVADLVPSASHEMRLPLRWIAILDPLVDASLAATTGIYAPEDVLKLVMVGADAVMLCAVLFREGPAAVTRILEGMRTWMHDHEYEGVHQMQGSMNHCCCSDPAAFERANYLRALHSFA